MKQTAVDQGFKDLPKFDHIFKWNEILLRILGVWPLEIKANSVFEVFGSNFLTFVLVIILASEIADLVNIWGQFDPMIDNMTASLAHSLTLAKITILKIKFGPLRDCFSEVWKDWSRDYSSEDLSTMLRRAKIGRTFSIAGPGFSVMAAGFYSVLPLTIKTVETSAPLPLRAVYFFDPTTTPVYEFVYFVQTVACYTSAIFYSGTDCFFAAVALHCCGQLEILGRKFRKIDKTVPGIENLVERHLRLIKFVKNLEQVYSSVILGQLLVGSFIICSIGYKFIMSLDEGNFLEVCRFSFYLTAILLQIFIYCYAGQCLIDESERLSEAVYTCPWYDMNASDARGLLLIQVQSQLPLQITASNFCVMSHTCFAEILRRSATYLSVLRAVKSAV